MTLKEHIKIQQKECLKYEVNSDEYNYHWDLLNYLCEVARLREENNNMLSLLVSKGILKELGS